MGRGIGNIHGGGVMEAAGERGMTMVMAVTVVEEGGRKLLDHVLCFAADEKRCVGNKDQSAREKRCAGNKDKIPVSAFSYYLCKIVLLVLIAKMFFSE